jgi:predicted secreted Zn-dependent protease
MRIRALLVAFLVVSASILTALQANAAGSIQFRQVYYDSPGTDRGSNSSLNAEYVTIKNTGSTTRTLTGWTVRSSAPRIHLSQLQTEARQECQAAQR